MSANYDPGQVYSPEADTYLLLEAVLPEVRQGDRVIEVGTGSGYIAAEIIRHLKNTPGPCFNSGFIIGTDINPHAVRCARARGVEVIRASLFDGLRGPFDLVVFNPPYLPTTPDERIEDWLEYALDGGPDGRAVISRFACEAGRVLAPLGRIVVLISSLTGADAVTGIFGELGYGVEIIAKRRVFDEDLLVLRIVRN